MQKEKRISFSRALFGKVPVPVAPRGIFLVPARKIPKNPALTVKPLGTFWKPFLRWPAFKPPSPEDPSRPPVVPGVLVGGFEEGAAEN